MDGLQILVMIVGLIAGYWVGSLIHKIHKIRKRDNATLHFAKHIHTDGC